jgi:hypothetical protein
MDTCGLSLNITRNHQMIVQQLGVTLLESEN